MPGNKQEQFGNTLVTLMLLMAANTPDPEGRLNELGRAITSMQEAIKNMHAGLEAFHTQVLPMFMQLAGNREPQKENR